MSDSLKHQARHVELALSEDETLARPSYQWCRNQVLAKIGAVLATIPPELKGPARRAAIDEALVAAIRPLARKEAPDVVNELRKLTGSIFIAEATEGGVRVELLPADEAFKRLPLGDYHDPAGLKRKLLAPPPGLLFVVTVYDGGLSIGPIPLALIPLTGAG